MKKPLSAQENYAGKGFLSITYKAILKDSLAIDRRFEVLLGQEKKPL
jgi:hypothetical protein